MEEHKVRHCEATSVGLHEPFRCTWGTVPLCRLGCLHSSFVDWSSDGSFSIERLSVQTYCRTMSRSRASTSTEHIGILSSSMLSSQKQILVHEKLLTYAISFTVEAFTLKM